MARSAVVLELLSTMLDPGCDLGVLRDELVLAASTISSISQGLSVQLAKAEQRTEFLKARITELEAEQASTSLRLQTLEAQNAELCRLLERSQPELASALKARDAALRKLHLMRELVQDLIDERRQASRPGARQPLSRRQTETDVDSSDSAGTQLWSSFKPAKAESSMGEDDEDVFEGERKSPGRSRPPESSPGPEPKDDEVLATSAGAEVSAERPSGDPVPLGGSMPMLSDNKDARPAKRVARCEAPRANAKPNSKSGRVHKIRPSAPLPTSTRMVPDTDNPSKTTAPYTQQDVQTSLGETEWYVEYQRPPATAIRPVGLNLQSLGERLGLDEDTMTRIESLEDWREPSLRLHIHHDMAFVYHPVVLEGPATTYLISWGDAIVNANVARYLTNSPDRPADRIFHLFVKNVGRDTWYYLGRQEFVVADLPSMWHTNLDEQNKHELVEALNERWTWQNAPHIEQIARLIETREVAQCLVELRSDANLQEQSQGFASRLSQK